jgi:hypothetical protein
MKNFEKKLKELNVDRFSDIQEKLNIWKSMILYDYQSYNIETIKDTLITKEFVRNMIQQNVPECYREELEVPVRKYLVENFKEDDIVNAKKFLDDYAINNYERRIKFLPYDMSMIMKIRLKEIFRDFMKTQNTPRFIYNAHNTKNRKIG